MKNGIIRHLISTLMVSALLIVPGARGQGTIYSTINNEDYNYEIGTGAIKNVSGKFYAYIVLLFNENPHFVNLIQNESIPLKIMAIEGYHIKEYKNYLAGLKDRKIKETAEILLNIYLEPTKYSLSQLQDMENRLMKWNIILRFTRSSNISSANMTLDYCIYGKKLPINIKHPLLHTSEVIYNVQPYIYYDEFSTSNSTFYFDMIYINPAEVQNDYIIAKKIISNQNVRSMFFVGSRVTEDIKYCLLMASKASASIKEEIWNMFVIHELTHKILNNKYNNFDQVTGEELSLISTIYSNPYLGLSVLYSYLNYNAINPHKIAAMNIVSFMAKKTGNGEIAKKPGLIKLLPINELKQYAREHFEININSLNLKIK